METYHRVSSLCLPHVYSIIPAGYRSPFGKLSVSDSAFAFMTSFRSPGSNFIIPARSFCIQHYVPYIFKKQRHPLCARNKTQYSENAGNTSNQSVRCLLQSDSCPETSLYARPHCIHMVGQLLLECNIRNESNND